MPPSLARIIRSGGEGDLAIRPPWVLLPWPSNPPLPYSLCATHPPLLPAAHFLPAAKPTGQGMESVVLLVVVVVVVGVTTFISLP